jgi:hypothetical protein
MEGAKAKSSKNHMQFISNFAGQGSVLSKVRSPH